MLSEYKVLFVDDEVNILKSLERALMDEDYECLFAGNGITALEILGKNKISIMVTDMRMPEMDGLMLCKEVELKHPEVIKIVLTGYTQLQQILATINSVDIFKLLTKPWDLDHDLKPALERALNQCKLRMLHEQQEQTIAKQAQAYQTILRTMERNLSKGKRSFEMLQSYMKAILSFNKNILNEQKLWIYEKEEEIYGLFDDFEIGENQVIHCSDYVESIRTLLSNLTIKFECETNIPFETVKFRGNFLTSLILACINVIGSTVLLNISLTLTDRIFIKLRCMLVSRGDVRLKVELLRKVLTAFEGFGVEMHIENREDKVEVFLELNNI